MALKLPKVVEIDAVTASVAASITGKDWRVVLLKAKAKGALVTKQNPFRIFQYHEHLLVAAGFLNVTTAEVVE